MNRWIRDLRLLRRMNWTLTFAVLALLAIGVLFVYSSCYISEEQPVRTLYKRQALWVLVGAAAYVFFAVLDYRELTRLSWWLYTGCAVLLLAVLFVGTRIYGARRWLMIFGVGVQPSELAKLAVILALARLMSRPKSDLGSFKVLVAVGIVVLVPVLLILKEPDLGTAMVFVPVTIVLMFAGGFPLRTLAALVLVGVLVIGLVLSALVLPERFDASEETQARIRKLTGLSEYQFQRIRTFIGVDDDPLGAGWNKMQSMIAVGSGGAWGKGFKNGTQNILGFLPRSVAPTDFIYSVIAEEWGFFRGSLVVLLLFCLVVFCGTQAALGARDKVGRLLCVGVVTLVFCHVLINIAMTVGLMPITGLPLPLLSYGGSFMVVMMSALGIVQSVYIRSRRVGMM